MHLILSNRDHLRDLTHGEHGRTNHGSPHHRGVKLHYIQTLFYVYDP